MPKKAIYFIYFFSPGQCLVHIFCASCSDDLFKHLAIIVYFYTKVPVSVVGHEGNVVFGYLSGKYVMCIQGRFHPYEHAMQFALVSFARSKSLSLFSFPMIGSFSNRNCNNRVENGENKKWQILLGVENYIHRDNFLIMRLWSRHVVFHTTEEVSLQTKFRRHRSSHDHFQRRARRNPHSTQLPI